VGAFRRVPCAVGVLVLVLVLVLVFFYRSILDNLLSFRNTSFPPVFLYTSISFAARIHIYTYTYAGSLIPFGGFTFTVLEVEDRRKIISLVAVPVLETTGENNTALTPTPTPIRISCLVVIMLDEVIIITKQHHTKP